METIFISDVKGVSVLVDPGVPGLRISGLEVGFQLLLILPKASSLSGVRSLSARAVLFYFHDMDVVSLTVPQPHSAPFRFLEFAKLGLVLGVFELALLSQSPCLTTLNC